MISCENKKLLSKATANFVEQDTTFKIRRNKSDSTDIDFLFSKQFQDSKKIKVILWLGDSPTSLTTTLRCSKF